MWNKQTHAASFTTYPNLIASASEKATSPSNFEILICITGATIMPFTPQTVKKSENICKYHI